MCKRYTVIYFILIAFVTYAALISVFEAAAYGFLPEEPSLVILKDLHKKRFEEFTNNMCLAVYIFLLYQEIRRLGGWNIFLSEKQMWFAGIKRSAGIVSASIILRNVILGIVIIQSNVLKKTAEVIMKYNCVMFGNYLITALLMSGLVYFLSNKELR